MRPYVFILTLAACTPGDRQDVARVAVHAAVADLIEYCKPTDTIEFCINKLIELGIREIKLQPPQDAGAD